MTTKTNVGFCALPAVPDALGKAENHPLGWPARQPARSRKRPPTRHRRHGERPGARARHLRALGHRRPRPRDRRLEPDHPRRTQPDTGPGERLRRRAPPLLRAPSRRHRLVLAARRTRRRQRRHGDRRSVHRRVPHSGRPFHAHALCRHRLRPGRPRRLDHASRHDHARDLDAADHGCRAVRG